MYDLNYVSHVRQVYELRLSAFNRLMEGETRGVPKFQMQLVNYAGYTIAIPREILLCL